MVVPTALDAANPPALISATAGVDEVHVTVAVMSWCVPLENAPRAVYCRSLPRAILVLVGDVAMDVRMTGVTISVDAGLEVIVLNAAVTKVVPVA
jgi:hypothetical protein